jgi:hypothetical protein
LGELILLDGAPGVGKSRQACLYAAACTHTPAQNDQPCLSLFISSPQQVEMRTLHLHFQEPQYQYLREVAYTAPVESPSPEHLLHFIEHNVREHKPLILVVDAIEELLSDALQAPEAAWLHFWTQLRALAKETNSIIIVPRSQGMHENRQYGAFARTGSQCARIIHTLHYHPTNPLFRVLTNVKNQYGVVGTQYHCAFNSQGRLGLRALAPHQHVRPARQIQTWQPAAEVDLVKDEIMTHVVKIMKNEPIRKKVLEAEIVNRGYSRRAFARVMAAARLPSCRYGQDWYYMPTPESREFFKEEQNYDATVNAARQSAGLSPFKEDEEEIDFSEETPAQRADTKVYDDTRKAIMRKFGEIMARARGAAGGRSESEASPPQASKV